jgi:DNA-binding CsgD family transcriptional regulator/PAS domain-containing protein
VRSTTLVRIDPQLVEALLGHYATRNPWRPFERSSFRPGSVIAVEEMVPVSDLRRTEFHDGILRPAQVLHAFGACLFRAGKEGITFTALRSAEHGPFQPAELTRISLLLPHLRRALQISNRLSQLERTRAALVEGLERLTHGVFVVSRQGRVIFANRTARSIVAQRDGLAIQADGLSAASYTDRLKLRSLIAQALRTASGEGSGAGGAMTVARPSLKRPFQLLATPLRVALGPGDGLGLATVFVSDPEAPAIPGELFLEHAYGLTAGEARLASAFAASGRLEDAAQSLSIGHETARWHLKHIYRKTKTARQSELLRLLVEGAGRLDLAARAPSTPPRAS